MQLDKETIIKQRFWFLLPFVAIFILVCWICVLGVRGRAAENYKAAEGVNGQLKTIASTQKLKNPKWIDDMTAEAARSEAKKEELWYREYNRQNDVRRDPKDPLKGTILDPIRDIRARFITWPDATRAQWNRTNGQDLLLKDFGEYLGNVPRDEYISEYPQQFEPVLSIIHDWLDESNPNRVEGAIRVPGRSLNHRDNARSELLKPWRLNKEHLVLSDEAWLLQEDLALKREVFQSLADLLTSYSKLKPEWDQVEFVEVKPAPQPSDPSSAATATPANPVGLPTTPVVKPTATATVPATADAATDPQAKPAEATPSLYPRLRFYNHVWPNLLDADAVAKDGKLAPTMVEFGLPSVALYKGWRLDLLIGPDERDENKLVLRPVSGNHSDVFTLPTDVQLAVWYDDPSGKPVPQPILITDAGGVGPCQYWRNGTLKTVSEKKLKELPLPANFGKITHVTRALPAGAVDQQVAFNDEWIVSARLLRRENTAALTLTGDIINRSGRRLPASTFTAALLQPNESRPMLEDFRVPTDAFNAGQHIRFQTEIRTPILPNRIDFVQQKLNWRTTPIKRIERLELGQLALANSDRLKTLPLLPYDFKRKDPAGLNKDAAAAPAPSGQSQQGGGMGGEPPPTFGAAGQKGGSGGGGGGGNSSGETTPNNGIPTQRYIQATPQLRRIPVALVMTVDSTSISDIIAAMSNSKLRFQVTMAPWVRVPNLGRPGAAAGTAGGNTGGAPAGGGGGVLNKGGGKAGAVGAGGGGGAMSTPPPAGDGGASRPGGAPAPGVTGGAGGGGNAQPPGNSKLPPAGAVGLEDDSSVVELQIYGIVTIYESPDAWKRILSTPPANPAGSSTPATGGTPTK